MKRFLIGTLLMSVVALPAMAALKEGDSAPRFTAQASLAGKSFTFSLQKALRKGPVVVYFYPSAYTGGCDIEAHTFAQDSGKFAAAGATIIGVSLDSIQRLNDFSADPKYCAGKFPTASDAGGAISKSYDIEVHQGPAGLKDVRGVEIGHGFADRTTFVIARDGRIVSVIRKVSPGEHVAKALEEVQKLQAKSAGA
ncbi:MAG: redoxin domain-containing protein [Gammaproteobacteria bacterium]|nr:redoxin domain-containing protein [Gammaproteobacteria bacterium]MDE2261775.1 redoxin domain-containing protein [Gammaproteobacteria bacterium]